MPIYNIEAYHRPKKSESLDFEVRLEQIRAASKKEAVRLMNPVNGKPAFIKVFTQK